MSRLRELLQATKEEDPARNITVSVPTSVYNWIEKIMTDTGLGRSTVVKALLQDGLIEYLNAPVRERIEELRRKLEAPDFEGYFVAEDLATFLSEFGPEDSCEGDGNNFDVDFVFFTLRGKMESNRKLVMG